MRRAILLALVGAMALAAPALADPPSGHHPPGQQPSCAPRLVGYEATGMLVSGSLALQTNGDYNGTLVVNVTDANHDAALGTQTFTLTHAEVKLGPGINAAALTAGAGVKLHGQITQLPESCPTGGFTAVVTIRSAAIGTMGPKHCKAHSEGYNATGTLVSASLVPQGGHRYNGTIVVNVARANHGAPTGSQTFTLTDAKVFFHDGVNPAGPAVGSEVGLHGKITELPKGCSTGGFTPTITIKRVGLSMHGAG
jgi:hypothetical protein